MHRQLEPLHEKLKKAYQLLEPEGIELPELKPLGDPVKPTKPVKPEPPKKDAPAPPPAAGAVSFVKQIVPLIMDKCGNCHVNKASGQFGMPTYEALMKGNKDGKVIFPGDANGSRFIEVIESGDMPRNGKLSEEQFAMLKKWINEGAKFDGTDPQERLAALLPAGSVPATPAPTIALDDGKGTVSFGRDIAGALANNCLGCHGNMNPRNNLSMTNFAGLLKGGDSKSPIKPGDGANSLLVLKLRGKADGMRMPAGNLPPFSDELIAKIEKWINEGAKFDGPDGSTPLGQVASLAKAASQNHEELAKDRADLAIATWNESMPSVKYDSSESENLLVMGNVGENTLKDIAEKSDKQIARIISMLGAPSDKPLQKGRFTLFVVKERYDFTEVAKVITGFNDIPPTAKGMWRYTGVDASGVIRMPKNESDYAIEALAAQQIASTYVSSVGKNVPGWFAEGVGRAVAASVSPNDSRVQEWNNKLPEVFSMLTSPDAFMGKSMEPEASSIASYSYCRFIMTDSKKFSRLLDDLRKGGKFDDLFAAAYGGTPNMIAPRWYARGPGKPSKAPIKSAAK